MSPASLDAIVFDFDGLIIDTETPVFQASAAAVRELGYELTPEAWGSVIGLGDDASFPALCAALDVALDQEAFDRAYARQDRSWRDTLPALPGVEPLLVALSDAGVPCGVASSSPSSWVESHLERLRLRQHFSVIATVDRVGGRAKPAPDTYLLACTELGASPARSVAIEDSAHGLAAAVAAGLHAMAVPNALTRFGDFGSARRVVRSLTEVGLADLVELIPVPGGAHSDPGRVDP